METGTSREYRRYGDMFTDRVAVMNRFNQVINASGNPVAYRGTITQANYNAILWLIEQMYLPRFAAATNHPNHADRYAGRQEMRLQLLTSVRESTSSNPLVTVANLNSWLSDDDIEVVQQIVLWQFTNADRPGNTSVVLRDGSIIENTLHIGMGTGNISGSHPNTAIAMRMLYDYLMAGARGVADGTRPFPLPRPEVTPEITLGNTSPTMEPRTVGPQPQWLVGPFSLVGTNLDSANITFANPFGTLRATANGSWTDVPNIPIGSGSGQARIVNANLETIAPNLQDMINEGQFFLMVPIIPGMSRDNITQFELEINYSYSFFRVRSACYYDVDLPLTVPQEQPVLIVDKERVAGSGRDNLRTPLPTAPDGSFNLRIRKFDNDDELIRENPATFSVQMLEPRTGEWNNQETNIDGILNLPPIEIQNNNETFIFRITENIPPTGYIGLANPFYVRVRTTLNQDGTARIVQDVMSGTSRTGPWANNNVAGVAVGNDGNIVLIDVVNEPEEKVFDLALRKFISSRIREGEAPFTPQGRVPQVSLTPGFSFGTGQNVISDLTYEHLKTPMPVRTGDTVIYTIRIFNEGNVAGSATEITDWLPSGVEFLPSHPINIQYEWVLTTNTMPDRDGNIWTAVRTNYHENTVLAPFDLDGARRDGEIRLGEHLDYKDVRIAVRVIATPGSDTRILRNVAEISEDDNEYDLTDRDSTPGDIRDRDSFDPHNPDRRPWHPERRPAWYDDEDYEDLVLEPAKFDLALRKFIHNVNGDREPGREPVVTLPERFGFGTGANVVTDLRYDHSKEPVLVRTGDRVVYTIRIFNEGNVAGTASEITDWLPAGTRLVPASESTINAHFGWVASPGDTLTDPNGHIWTAVRTTYHENTVLPAFDLEDAIIRGIRLGQNLHYKDVQIEVQVIATESGRTLRNVAEISEDDNEYDLTDRDSRPDNIDRPFNPWRPPGRPNWEDDEDWEELVLGVFDLALRKFITHVGRDGQYNRVEPSREPVVTMPSNFGHGPGLNSTLRYEHPKREEPVSVANGNIVIYTIRVYNEGTMAGFAAEIRDDLPAGLVFLPDHAINQRYEWNLYTVERNADGTVRSQNRTTNLAQATEARTRFLSHDQNGEAIRGTQTERNNLMQPFDPTQPIRQPNSAAPNNSAPWNPDFRDVRIAFQIDERAIPEGNTDRIIRNVAEITESQDEDGNDIDDWDSTPDNDIHPEDDQDSEYVYVKYFDLALVKFVSATRVTVDGATVTRNYAKPSDDPWSEFLVRIPLTRDQIRRAHIEVEYTIRVTNVGELAGTASEITDRFQNARMEFLYNHATNIRYGWELTSDNTIVTRFLEDEVIQPGESRDVQVVMRWRNSGDNLLRIQNISFISEYDNDYDAPDIDRKNEEDDAWVVLTPPEGGAEVIIPVMGSVVTILVVGMFFIKRYVLV